MKQTSHTRRFGGRVKEHKVVPRGGLPTRMCTGMIRFFHYEDGQHWSSLKLESM